jgi:uncharacterized protein (DUF362 family)
MALNRRDFLKASALGALGLALPSRVIAARSGLSGRFGVHPFIENHPEAVFIMRTAIRDKMDGPGKHEAGLTFGRSVFVPYDESGIPVNTSIPVKMNLKTTDAGRYPLEHILGTITDPFFAEGVFEGMQHAGISGRNIHLRENDRGNTFGSYGLIEMAERAGIDFRIDIVGGIDNNLQPGKDFNWTEVPDGKWFKKIPQVEPINRPDTWLLNMSKFKTHGMGVTLGSKNLQGIIARPFTRLCAPADSDMGISSEYRHENAVEAIKTAYERHVREHRIPRWDRPGSNGGIWQEVWSTRTLDHLSVTRPGLNIIEGIFGREGDSGNNGPHTPIAKTGALRGVTARDYISNFIIFGKDIFRTDIIGHWLAGHEPGNFGFFHLAMERGMSDMLNPRNIPIYYWDTGMAVLTPIDEIPRTPLMTYYLQRDYNGQNEPNYHLCNEPYDYSQTPGAKAPLPPEKVEAIVLAQSRITLSNPYLPIEYHNPRRGRVQLQILNSSGSVIATPVEGMRDGGIHLASWDTRKHGAGTYSWRFRADGQEAKGTIKLEKS